MADLATVCTDLLASVVDVFADAAIELPDRQYVTSGEVAFDCDDGQLVVSAQRIFRGNANEAQGDVKLGASRSVDLDIYLMRCVPTPDDEGNPPSGAALAAAGMAQLVDAWTLFRGVLKNKASFSDACSSMNVAECVAVGPEGGLGGWRMRLSVELV